MGFINWWQNNQEETDSQLNLLGDSQPLTRHERVDSATVNKDFTKAIKEAGGSDRAYPRAVRAETEQLFGCGVDELYESTGGSKGDRSTLPKEAQKAYMVSETLSAHRLHEEVKGNNHGSQRQKDDRVVETVKDTATHVRNWLPW
ncbi:hypothetical protein NDI52_07215 [Leptolyngbya sp. PL-A3]|uniref:hypothetical protein n=1 Tax=Leptolyngbya sp. PL-A3 TaxID=2933911 RepID=UPI003299344B